MSDLNVRPLGAIVISDLEETGLYSVTITSTAVSISNGTISYSSDYVGKSLRQVVTELNTSSFPVEIRAIADVNSLKTGELIATGSTIPSGFDLKDRTSNGKGAIVRVKRWAVKYKERKSISLLPPVNNGTTLPWHARVTDGEFTQKLNGATYTFSTPEYSNQTWSDKYGRPFKDVYGEPVVFRTANSISLKSSPVYWKNNIVLGTDEKTYPASIIKDVDQFNGVVFLQPGTVLPKNTLAYYSYIDESFEYKDLNINGHFLQNPYILDKYIVYYLKPTGSSTGINRSRGVYHVVSDSIEAAINFIPEESSGEPVAIIGAVSVRSYQNENEIGIIDTRTYGGGLRNDRIGEAAEKKHPRSQYFYDIGRKEGIPYPGAAAIVIDLPSELKEVLTVDEIKTRASKYIAAGIYPVFNFKEEDYEQQFEAVDGNANLSLFNNSITQSYTGIASGQYGSVMEPSYWAGSETAFPVPVEGTGYSALDFNITASVNTGESENYLRIPAGTKYSQKYLKSSADAIFSWEERQYEGQWQRKTARDSRSVPVGRLIGGKLFIDGSLGYKEVRRLKSFSPYIYNENALNDNLLSEASKVISNLSNVGIYGSTSSIMIVSGTIDDVIGGTFSYDNDIVPGFIPNTIGSLIDNYSSLVSANAMYDMDIFGGAAKYINDATEPENLAAGSFPGVYDLSLSSFVGYINETYNMADEIYYASRLAKGRVDYFADTFDSGESAIPHPSGAGLYTGSGDSAASLAQAGALQMYRRLMYVSPPTGTWNGPESDIISPYVNPSSGVTVELTISSNDGEFNPELHEDMYTAKYIKAAAALYSTLVLPIEGRSASGAGYPALYTDIAIDPMSLALSGIGHRYENFSSHITPVSGASALSDTWLSSYNRLSSYAAEVIDDTTSALDSIYYGNSEWAGVANTGEKNAPYYDATLLSGEEYLYDTFIRTGQITSVLYGIAGTPYDYIAYLIGKNYNIMLEMEDQIKTSSVKGGLAESKMPLLISSYLWLPIHNLKEEELFTEGSNFFLGGFDRETFVDIFEVAARSYIKGSIDENGITSEAGVFQWDRAPFYGGVPADMLTMCSKAIELYTLSGGTSKRAEWISIAEGLFNNTTGEYSKTYGYPYSTIEAEVMSGNIGGNQLGAYASLLGNKQTPYTAEEVLAITGAE